MEVRAQLKLAGGALMVALLTVACSPKTPAKGADTTNDSSPLVIEEIAVVGKDARSDASHSLLRPKKPLRLSIKTSRSAKNSTMEVKVFALSTGEVKEERVEHLGDDAPSTVDLELDNAKDWSQDRYLIEIRLDGKLAGQQEFDLIDIPEEAARP
ncbi:hypothetical protein [Pseudoxanthomonas sp.]|uniref:hypothetical protein n=1 Tax=Pseudoxanthomonas sp. TaxID=1871049 RepID=UPI003F80AACD